MTFTRKTASIYFSYSVDSVPLCKVCEINDLGVLFDATLHFSAHTKRVAMRGMRSLGSVCRLSREFKSPTPFRKLYTTICLPQLEYASVVWNGSSRSNSDIIDRVQKKFLSIYNHRFANLDIAPCTGTVGLLSLPSLRDRRNRADLLFLFKLLHGNITCPELLSCVMFRIPRKITREHRPFHVPPCHHEHSTVHRIQSLYNAYFRDLDIFHNSLSSFSSELCLVL